MYEQQLIRAWNFLNRARWRSLLARGLAELPVCASSDRLARCVWCNRMALLPVGDGGGRGGLRGGILRRG